jgi:Phage tail tube protein
MGGLRVSNEVILAETEVTYGVDPIPSAATNAILVRQPSWAQEGLRMATRDAIRGSIGQLQDIYGGELRKVSFEVEVKGSGTAGTPPEIAPLLRACGMDQTIVASTSVTYQPVSTGHESITIYFYEGGRKLHIMTGCRGNVSFSVEAGGLLLAQFDFTGHYTQATDAAQPTPTYNSTVPRTALNMALSLLGATNIVPRSFSFNLNNTIESGPSIAAADGYGQTIITKRAVTGEIEIETELDSIIDIDSLLALGTRGAFDSGLLGSVAGNRVRITTPASSTYVTSTSPGEGNGLRLRTVGFAVDDSTSDQELSCQFS